VERNPQVEEDNLIDYIWGLSRQGRVSRLKIPDIRGLTLWGLRRPSSKLNTAMAYRVGRLETVASKAQQ